MNWLDWLIVAMAVIYSAEVIAHKSGPFGVFDKVRASVLLGDLASCPWCMAPYLSLLYLAIYQAAPVLLWPLAVSGAAMALRSYTGARLDVG